MAKNAQETNEATPVANLYRVNYQYVAPTGALRAGAIVIESADASKAQKEAETRLSVSALRHPRITSVKEY